MKNSLRLSTLALLGIAFLAPSFAFAKMTLKSMDFKNRGRLNENQVHNGFGCKGADLSPRLSWSGAPENVKSYVITVFDRDAPTGSGWWHWTVFNIPSSVTELQGGIGKGAKLPEGAIQGRTDFGFSAFGGACPPVGAKPHRYVFTVYALPNTLDLDQNASGAMVSFKAKSEAIAKASITGTYGR